VRGVSWYRRLFIPYRRAFSARILTDAAAGL
jgi:hypothetical protein